MNTPQKSLDSLTSNKMNVKIGLGDSWKDVIFIPFNQIIQWLFMTVTYLSVIYNLYLLTYQPGYIGYFGHAFLDIFCEVYYFIVMVLIILHRIIKVHRQKKYYKCQPVILIIVDFISIVPITSLYAMINRYTRKKQFSDSQLKYNKCYLKLLRILRLFYFYFDLRTNLMYNQKKIIIMCHCLGSMLLIIILGSIYYYCGLYPSYQYGKTWMNYYLDANVAFDKTYHLNWFVLSTYEMLGCCFNNILDYIHGANNTDLLLLLIAMVFGFISQYIFLTGILTSEDLQGMRSKYILQLRLESAKRLMETLKMPLHLQKTVQSYYETIWNFRSGVVKMPIILEKLSPYMQQEILADIYWEALLHTKIFENVSSVFRRMVACQMKTEIYVPGHFVVKENEIKAKLVYLHAGMLEIYRMEKEDSRITVTGGTVLGEMSCVHPYVSTANVKCKTICTLHVLYITDFYKSLRKYNVEFKTLQLTHKNRLKYARNKLRSLKKTNMSHIKFVKTQWRNIIERPNTTFEPNFTSRFLDLITMTNIHIHPDAFCLRGNCPFVMKSNTNLFFTFHYLALIATIMHFFLSFRNIIFEGGIVLSNYVYYGVIDSILFIDIYIQLISTIDLQISTIVEPYEIFVYKLKNFHFVVDLLATIPLDYVLIVTSRDLFLIGLGRLNRYARLYKVVLFFRYYEERVSAYSGLLKVIKFLVYHTFLCLLLCCLGYMTICLNPTCNPNSWIAELKEQHYTHFGYNIPVSNYFICLYYTTNVYLKLLLRGYPQRFIPGILCRMVIVVLSYYILTLKIAQICSTFGLRYENKHLFLEYVDMIEVYVHENKELKKFKDKLLECLSTEWMISGDLRYKDLSQVTYQQSDFIQRNVNDEYILLILQNTAFFRRMSADLLLQLAHNCDIFLIPKDHDLIKVGERCFYLYVVVEGHCISYSTVPGDHENNTVNFYERFDVFPLLEYVHEIYSLLHVKSYTAVQLITIPYSVFSNCVRTFHFEARILRKGCKAHMSQYWGLLNGTTVSPFMKMPKVVSPEKDKPDVFAYKIKRQNVILDITNCSRQKANNSLFMKYRKCLKWSTLNTYSPYSQNFIVYETFRCLCIMVHMNLIYFMCVPYIYEQSKYNIVLWLFCLLWVVDMLVQAHLDYYNDYGILVTGFKATTKHYLTHSFALDLVAGLPYKVLRIHYLAPAEKQFALEIMILLNTRIFLLLRPLRFSNFLQGDGVTRFAKFMKYFTMLMLIYYIIMYLGAMKLLLICEIDKENRNIICPNDSCLMLRNDYLDWDNKHLYWISVKSILTTGDMADYVSTGYDHILTLILSILVISIRIGLLCKITGDNCIRQPRLVLHQNHLKIYNSFFANRLVSNSTKTEMLAHFKNIWQKSYSEKSHKIFENIYPYLRETLILTMYRKAVSKCILFQHGNEILFKLFIPYIEERYYKKSAEIIRTNDVQGNIFIVVKGLVEVSVAESKLCSIGPGAIFGCFEPLGLNRHTMAFKAELHVNLLVIKATRFYQLIKGFKKVEKFMTQLQFAQFQYAVISSKSYHEGASLISGDSARSNALNLQAPKIFKIFDYITNVHIAPVSAYLVLIDCHIEMGIMQLLPVWIILDLYYCASFITRGKLATVDSTTGMDVTQDLMKHYLKSMLIIVDIVTIMPLYLIRIWWFTEYHQFFFLCNKLLRIYYFYTYYASFVKSKNVPRHLHRTMLVYCSLFLVQIIFVVRWFTDLSTLDEKATATMMLKGYIDVMNYVSSLGLNDDLFPKQNTLQFIVEVLMVIMSTGLLITLVQLFTKTLLSENAHQCVYRFQAFYCRQFCILSNVSNALVKRTYSYLYQLYVKQSGEQFPLVYNYAPRYLKQDHMQSLFGRHFVEHPLFHDLHVDLVRQIQTYIKCYFYLPGAVIVEKGLKNGRIYFIESGKVVAIRHSGDVNVGTAYEILENGHSFGDIQALLHLEHNRTYKALTAVDLIFITITDWEYLLDWFPASKTKLYNRVNEHAELLKYA